MKKTLAGICAATIVLGVAGGGCVKKNVEANKKVHAPHYQKTKPKKKTSKYVDTVHRKGIVTDSNVYLKYSSDQNYIQMMLCFGLKDGHNTDIYCNIGSNPDFRRSFFYNGSPTSDFSLNNLYQLDTDLKGAKGQEVKVEVETKYNGKNYKRFFKVVMPDSTTYDTRKN